jgi:hypothetical protein
VSTPFSEGVIQVGFSQSLSVINLLTQGEQVSVQASLDLRGDTSTAEEGVGVVVHTEENPQVVSLEEQGLSEGDAFGGGHMRGRPRNVYRPFSRASPKIVKKL